MKKKTIILTTATLCVIGISTLYFVQKTNNTDRDNEQNVINNAASTESANVSKNNLKKNIALKKKSAEIKNNIKEKNNVTSEIPDNNIVHTNIYSDSSSELPLSAITELSELPHNIQEIVSEISKTNNIFMVKKIKDKLLIITDSYENIRHNIEFVEVSIHNGHKIHTTLGYNDTFKDTKNDIWEFNHETNQPIRHTKYNADGDMDFVEVWNYDSNEPIKYEMKDAQGKVISLKKETLNNGTDLRVENLLYDKDGNTKVNVSTTYDGEDIKRFTYYNSDKPSEGGAIFSDYTDGQKTKETVYTSDLKVKNTYTSDYKDGLRKDIIMYDNQNREVKKYLPAEKL